MECKGIVLEWCQYHLDLLYTTREVSYFELIELVAFKLNFLVGLSTTSYSFV